MRQRRRTAQEGKQQGSAGQSEQPPARPARGLRCRNTGPWFINPSDFISHHMNSVLTIAWSGAMNAALGRNHPVGVNE
jgi:hypothetical protein